MNDIKSIIENFKRKQIKENIIGEIFSLIFVIMCNMNIFLLTLWIISILITFFKIKKRLKNVDNVYNSLSDKKINQLNYELNQPLMFITENNWILTTNYIIIQNNKFDIINYDDIILMYYKFDIKLTRFSKFKQSIIIISKNNSKYKFSVDIDNNEDFIKCSTILKEKNPNILEEKNKRNIKIIKEKYNIDIT